MMREREPELTANVKGLRGTVGAVTGGHGTSSRPGGQRLGRNPDGLGLQAAPLPGHHSSSTVALLRLCPLTPPCPSSASQGSVVSERDYESLVMMRMRQAAERQQLIAQMQREDKVGQPT